MGQLIKLQDHISRYETDIFHYPGQFIRLKKERYELLKDQWNEEEYDSDPETIEVEEEPEKRSLFSKWRAKTEVESPEEDEPEPLEMPESEEELKQWFLDQIFDFQLKWASGTIKEISYPNPTVINHPRLKYFLQRFPDSYLLMFDPIFKIKKATIDGGIILITPLEILCIHFLETEDDGTIYESIDDKRWAKRTSESTKTFLNPMIHLNRIEKMVRSMLDYHEFNFPVKKVLIAEQATIQSIQQPYMNTEFIDKHIYENWFSKYRSGGTPLKYQQLKAAEALLAHTQTTSFIRPEWEDDDERGEFSLDSSNE